MGIINNIANIMKGYDFEEPFIVKESNQASHQVLEMMQFRNELNSEGQELIDDEIRLLQAGIYGEDAILYELKNSHLPIVVLRDLHLSRNGLHAQIDFIVLTPRGNLVIECKNMIGDIEVNSDSDFVRKFTYGKRTIKKGIYSPITQNTRHLDLLRDIFKDNQDNFILRKILDNEFTKKFVPYVVMANSNSILNIKYAKKEVKEKIIRLDQLNNKVREVLFSSENPGYRFNELVDTANHILNYHQVKPYDFKQKYESYLKDVSNLVIDQVASSNNESNPMYIALKKYRLEQSHKENVKPYFIFNNVQLEALVNSAPKNKQALLKINGFGPVKCEKYGEEIIKIINMN